jgi:signal transduction histidine kinase
LDPEPHTPRRHSNLSSLRVQAIIWLLLPFAVTLGLILVVSAVAYQQVVGSLIIARDQELATVAAQRVSEKLDNYANILAVLSNDPGLASADPAQRFRVLNDASLQLESFDAGVYVMDASGRIVTSYPDSAQPETPVNLDPYFRSVRASRAPAFSDILDQPGSADSLIVVLVPILTSTGDFAGALVGAFGLENRQLGEGIVSGLRIGEEGQAYLVDRQGRVIFHPDPGLSGRDVRSRPVVQRVLQGERGALVSQDAGTQSVYGYATVPVSGWGLVTQESFATLIAPIRPYVGTVLLVLGLGLLFGLFWLPLGARRITRPIDRLVQAAERLAAGREAVHVDGGTIQELQVLADSFNEMAEQIERSRAGQRKYVAMVTRSQEDERRRIARELHDGTVQALVAIGRRLELIAQRSQDSATISELAAVRQQVSEAANEVRRFSRELRPLVLEDLGLAPALRYLSNQHAEEFGTPVNLTVHGSLRGLPPDQELVLFRIYQETLTNVSKHAQATQVDALLEVDAEGLLLEVVDDGQGFEATTVPTDLAQRGHFGLMGIQERVQLLGGRLTIDSTPGQGTRVKIWLPHSSHFSYAK